MLFERPNAAALCAHLREEFPEACARYAGAPAVAKPVNALAAPASLGDAEAARLVTLVPRWFPVRAELAPSPARAIALIEAGPGAALSNALRARLGSRVGFCGNASEFGSALAGGLTFDEVWLVAVDHDVAFSVIKQLIHDNAFAGPLSLKAITLDCFQVHDEAVSTDAAHGVWGLLQSTSREYPQVAVAELDLCASELTKNVV